MAVEVQENAESGRVRTTVTDRTKDRYLHEVEVKVIGSRNEEFISGETDLRGVFVADGVRGTSTVIARADTARYAFFRGETELLPQTPEVERQSGKKADQPAKPAPQMDADLLEGLQNRNTIFQKKNVQLLDEMYQSEQGGVKAEAAF